MKGGTGMKAGHGSPQHGIRSEVGFVWRSIEFNHHLIDDTLFIDWQAHKCFFKVVFDVVHGLGDAFAKVGVGIAISQFKSLISAR